MSIVLAGMDRFVDLYFQLDETNSSNKKIEILQQYLKQAEPANAIWVVYFFVGNRFKRLISSRQLRRWVRSKYDLPKWLFEEAMVAVGDTAETVSLVIHTVRGSTDNTLDQWPLHIWIEKIQDLRHLSDQEQQTTIEYWWDQLDQEGIFILNKLLTGAFRVGVSKQTIARALANAFELEKTTILHRLMGNWKPTPQFFQQLISDQTSDTRVSVPYPFFLATPLEKDVDELGPVENWFVEWKWDGIRAQIIKREGKIFIWSRGEELINTSFPELVNAMEGCPDGVVLDAEILAYHGGEPLAFSVLQRRIGRQDVNSQVLQEAPVILMVYDIMEFESQDIRDYPHQQRRDILEDLLQDHDHNKIALSSLVPVSSWQEVETLRQKARDKQAEGLMLKNKNASYQVGRKRGDWFKYKVDPMSVDAILLYAQSGSGRRANLFTAYTFAVWDGDELVPIGRAYSGLTDTEIQELDSWIRSHTTERFGPVRSVDPVQVFELGFDGIMTNDRTKSGLSLRFPRMLRWRRDKPPTEADTLDTVQALLKYEGNTEVKLNHSLDEFF